MPVMGLLYIYLYLVVDIVQLHAPDALPRGNECRYSLNTWLWDPLCLPRRIGDIFLGEDDGNLAASLQTNYYFVCGLEGFTVVWLRTSAVAYYDMSGTEYPAAGRNIPEGHGLSLFGRWEVVYLITLAVNWLPVIGIFQTIKIQIKNYPVETLIIWHFYEYKLKEVF